MMLEINHSVKREIALIVPCFNESSRWNYEYWKNMIEIDGLDWFFVDDGSKDNTGEILAKYEVNSNCNYHHLEKNSGKSEAVRSGLVEALNSGEQYKYIGFIDADGCVSLADVQRMTQLPGQLRDEAIKFDAIWASRIPLSGRVVKRSVLRHTIGRILAKVFKFGVGDLPYDTQCGFKIFEDSACFRESLQNKFKTRWLFDLEIHSRLRSRMQANPVIWEEPLNQWIEVGGSKINSKESFRIIYEIVLMKYLQIKRKQG